ncbi:MAG: hypothetical protein AAF678_05645 [Pseudomonadota bacterium]
MTESKSYYVKFDVEKDGEILNGIRVRLDRKIHRSADDKRFSIDLADDPLYPALAEYVKNNPPRR